MSGKRNRSDLDDEEFGPSAQFIQNQGSNEGGEGAEGGDDINVEDYFTQNLSKRKKKSAYMTQFADDDMTENGANSESATAGIIEKIVLKNFMCHDFFELELGPQLNFIIGHNGSGKSAILTGISVCLGAKASDTNRGGSIRSLIKDGRSAARITVIFKNEGSEAYNPEIFGDKIIIERSLKRQGGAASSYSIKSENMKTISTKKSMLDEILLKFNIPIDNPMAFLSQDKAREFLTSTSDGQKYQYFMAGSLITDTIDHYSSVEQNIVEVKEKLKLAQMELNSAQKTYDSKRAEYAKYKQSDNLRQKLAVLHGKVYWFKVSKIEAVIEENKEAIERSRQEIEVARSEIESIENQINNSDELKQKAVNECAMANENYDNFAETYQQLVTQIKKVAVEINEYSDTIKTANREIEKNYREIGNLKISIQNEQKRIDSLNGGSRDSLEADVESNEKKKVAADEELGRLKEELIGFGNNLERDRITLRRKKDAITRRITELENNKKELINSQGDKYAPFGRNIARALNEIQRDNRFHNPPIGPLGLHVSIKEEHRQWRNLINAILNKTLDSFLVQDSHDHKLLDEVLRKNGIQKSIIVRRSESFNFQSGCPTGVLTMLDAIEIDNQDVYYSIIDAQHIEKNVLEQNRQNVRNIIERGDRRIMNVLSLLDGKGGQRTSGSNGGLRIDPVYFRNEAPKISVGNASNDDDIRAINQELAEENGNLTRINQEMRDLDNSTRGRKAALETDIVKVEQNLQKLERMIFKIRNKLEEDNDMANIESFKANISDLEVRNEQQKSVIQSLEQEKYVKEQKYSEAQTYFKSQRKGLENLKELLEQKKENVAKFDASKNYLGTKKAHFEQSIRKRDVRIATVEVKINSWSASIQEFINTARTFCERDAVVFNPQDTEDTVIQEFNRVDRAVKDAESTLGRPFEEVMNEVVVSKKVVEKADGTVGSLKGVHGELRKQLTSRIRSMENTIDFWIQEAALCFSSALRLRGFSGDLLFDFTKKTLTMIVKTPTDKVGRTIESLSGGEKSFTQIALLLSIWKPMRSRIRGLDEFDVYMDSVNRGIGIKLLLAELKKYPKSQTIFITPQDIADVGDIDKSNVRIHRIHDPRRANNSAN